MNNLAIKRSLRLFFPVLAVITVPLASEVSVFADSVVAITEPGDKKPLPTYTPNLNIMKVAHRGVKVRAPENTLPAIQKAIDMGYDYVEVDLRYSRDGAPVLFHDLRLSPKTNGFGFVAWRKFTALKKLDAGSWFSDEFKGTRIPTFEECLKSMQGRINLYLDQKESPKPELFQLLNKYGFSRDKLVVVGFLKRYQRKFAKHYPNAPVMPWLSNAAEVEKVLEKFPTARAFNTSCKSLTRDMVIEAHRHGVMIFTNVLRVKRSKERDCMRRTIELGADAVQFDHPDVLFPLLEEMRRKNATPLSSEEYPL